MQHNSEVSYMQVKSENFSSTHTIKSVHNLVWIINTENKANGIFFR